MKKKGIALHKVKKWEKEFEKNLRFSHYSKNRI